MSVTQNLILNNYYSFECTPTEPSAGCALPCIANDLPHNICHNLKIYKKSALESTSIVIINLAKSNTINGVIYRHLKMDKINYNNNFFNNLLLGDSNIDLINAP